MTLERTELANREYEAIVKSYSSPLDLARCLFQAVSDGREQEVIEMIREGQSWRR